MDQFFLFGGLLRYIRLHLVLLKEFTHDSPLIQLDLVELLEYLVFNWILGDFTRDSILGGDRLMLELFNYYRHTVSFPLVIK